MDVVLIVLGVVFLILGVIGCIAPIIPGPPVAFLSLIALIFHSSADVVPETNMLVWLGFLVIAATVLDYFLPIWGTKKFGGTDAGKTWQYYRFNPRFYIPCHGAVDHLGRSFCWGNRWRTSIWSRSEHSH